jgi:lipoprotein-anchoring transpeptidase ErfK/SrfK
MISEQPIISPSKRTMHPRRATVRALGLLAAWAAAACAPRAPECLEPAGAAPPETAGTGWPPASAMYEIPRDTTLHLVLNVPSFTVQVMSGDSVVRAYPVAVGSPRYPTRLGSYAIRTITWNPWWVPPASDWARGAEPTPPGPANPMGKVKLNYTAAYYLHGTPDSNRLRRAVSHGCVRMQNRDAVELALLLQDATGVQLSAEQQQRVMTDWQASQTIQLERAVQLDVQYRLASMRDSFIVLYRDIYDRADGAQAAAVLAELTSRGIPPAAIDSAAVHAFAERQRHDGGAVSVRSLMRDQR